MALLSNRQGRHGRRRRPLWMLAFAIALAGVLAAAILLAVTRNEPSRAEPPRSADRRSVGRVAVGAPKSWPAWGFTHTQYSAGIGEQGATDAVRGSISRQPVVQAQAIMGWGVDNPEPARDQYNFGSLDQRMDL
ncbi:xylan 1,4-beta-xylosidase, partial [Actinomadura sp. HBU206391]|nr:xylan 1,4-beta-xylosidase [Actinomadura sp. HBU206391]